MFTNRMLTGSCLVLVMLAHMSCQHRRVDVADSAPPPNDRMIRFSPAPMPVGQQAAASVQVRATGA